MGELSGLSGLSGLEIGDKGTRFMSLGVVGIENELRRGFLFRGGVGWRDTGAEKEVGSAISGGRCMRGTGFGGRCMVGVAMKILQGSLSASVAKASARLACQRA